MPLGGSQSNDKDGGKGGPSRQDGSTETTGKGKATKEETDEESTLAIDEMKLSDLKDELRKLGISATGNKSQLKERLRKDTANNEEDDTTSDEDGSDSSDSTDDEKDDDEEKTRKDDCEIS
ncbi:hypothetical protein ALC57_01870 [Trachymyrmex cornetzi]|uniref:SAP domain-containing protein n=1 Tax=Trachymyrmex cornetzi TaxID=471704 RepID=A0A151JQ50_9HYME|nr:hypothetical protein ALC57_14513 [Trachymyrmex cornetzi]KYN28704.1 hypothetical protein ALC57_01870 [Trachymyrmex cornetzi]